MNQPHFDIYGENDLEVFKALAFLVAKERVTGLKPTVEEIRACGQLENVYPADAILSIVMVFASGEDGQTYKLERMRGDN